MATAFLRCWHLLILFGLWGAAVCLINDKVRDLSIQPTLLTVFGTVLGFVISYRTTSAFERYNEGRRLFSQIILANRTFARTVWLHVPDVMPEPADLSKVEQKARSTIEKKTIINLLEGFSVAVKHYLRGEDTIYYTDLYHLVKFLPAYALPAGMVASNRTREGTMDTVTPSGPLPMRPSASQSHAHPNIRSETEDTLTVSEEGTLPQPVTAPTPRRRESLAPPRKPTRKTTFKPPELILREEEEDDELLPASSPPKYHILDVFPLSFILRNMTNKGSEIGGRNAARLRAKMMMKRTISHNLPLEITFYLSSYISKLQSRKILDVPTLNTLFFSLNQLVDALTGLERVLTTPIPFSYAFHLWLVTMLYCLFLPFQLWTALGWVTIPATVFVSLVFFGFLVAGEEIEDPFGYDANDLDLDHFTHNIIRNELRALTSAAPPNIEEWAFVPENNVLFTPANEKRRTPQEWLDRGYYKMQDALVLSA